MKKKIIVLLDSYEDYLLPIQVEAGKLGAELVFALYAELICETNHNLFSMTWHNEPLENYDLVYCRNAKADSESNILVAEYCRIKKIPLLDRAFLFLRPWIGRKSFQYLRLSQLNLPLIDTFFVTKEMFAQIKSAVTYPCIVKASYGGYGKEVHLCQNQNDVLSIFEKYQTKLLIQKYIVNNGDLRVFVIGNEVVASMKRIASDGEFRNNIAQGAKGEKYEPSEEVKQLALKAVRALDYAVSGVDLIFDDQAQEWKVMEVNRAPLFDGIMEATGVNIPQKIAQSLNENTH